LQFEAARKVDAFVKAPLFIASGNRVSNPAQSKAQRRGVRYRCIYERAILDDPAIKPYIAQWVSQGEEARIYDGELPHKLQIFDEQIVLIPLIRPAEQIKTVLIRHPQLAQSLTLAFEHLWARSIPFAKDNKPKPAEPSAATAKGESDDAVKSLGGKMDRLVGPNSNRVHGKR
jgi:hypothetical protein